MAPPNLTDAEIDEICAGLKLSAAKVRFLTSLGLKVARKPNGAPLVSRAHYDRVMGNLDASAPGADNGPVWGVHEPHPMTRKGVKPRAHEKASSGPRAG